MRYIVLHNSRPTHGRPAEDLIWLVRPTFAAVAVVALRTDSLALYAD